MSHSNTRYDCDLLSKLLLTLGSIELETGYAGLLDVIYIRTALHTNSPAKSPIIVILFEIYFRLPLKSEYSRPLWISCLVKQNITLH